MTEIEISEELIERVARRVLELLIEEKLSVKKKLLFSEHARSLTEVFPTYPQTVAIENPFEAQDALSAKQIYWYSKEGFSSKAAGAIVMNQVDPLRLLTMQKGEITFLRNIGPVKWTEIERWQKQNQELIPKEGRQTGLLPRPKHSCVEETG